MAKVFISYVPEDEAWRAVLEVHLASLLRGGSIQVWHAGHLAAGEAVGARTRLELESADVVLILVSPDYLASDNATRETEIAIRRRNAGSATIVPILIRPCHWESSPLAGLVMLPRDGKPVRQSNNDAAWTSIIQELSFILRGDGKRPRHGGTSPPTEPDEILPIDDIFRITGVPGITYVEPDQLPRLRTLVSAMGTGLVVEGPSGVGKTTVVRKALQDIKATKEEWLISQNDADRKKLDDRLTNGFSGHLIIDEFHRLDGPRQARVADAMKMIADRSKRDSKITVIGINPVGDSLVAALPDLAGRFKVVRMGRQPDAKVEEMIRKGEQAANISFARRDELVLAAAGSLFTAQQLCYEAALKAGVTATQKHMTVIEVGFRDVVDEVLEELDGRYFALIRGFACHDERVPPRGATLALLWLVSKSDDGHVTLEDVRYRFPDKDIQEALLRLKNSYLTKCFEDSPALKSLFYYNKGSGVLSIEDPRLAFYLRYMSWAGFIERTNHRNARIDSEGNLVFSKRAHSDRVAAKEEIVTILHLSDLHFSQLAQAEVWYNQLAEDIKELECEEINALVLSGDLTQRADKVEFEAARQFLLRVSTEFKLSPGQVVVVPGNHDLSWTLSKSAYELQRRADYKSPLEEGKFIEHGTEVVEVRDEVAYRRRFEPFSEFYGLIKGSPYPSASADQIDLQDFAAENVLFLGLNSAWEIDHHFKSRAGIHPEALTRALSLVRQNSAYGKRIKIAVWHHPLTTSGEDRVKDQGVMEQLAKAGFRLVLHGHIHKAENNLFRFDMSAGGRRIDLIAAGTFGAPTTEWVPGYPLQYNLLRISKDKVVVETRRREEPNGAWKPDARWLQGPGKDPLPRYDVPL